MKSPGFSMLEIIVVMAVSTIIMTCLFEIYNQTSSNMNKVQRFVLQDSHIITLQHRLEKDFTGLSAIWYKQSDFEKIKAQQEKKEPSKDFKKQSFYFYSTNKDQQLDILTFITTSSLQSYGDVSSSFVRVVYKLEPDTINKGLFKLMRKEIFPATEFIDEKVLNAGNFYELTTGIKSIQVSYHLVDRVALNKQFRAEKKEGQKEQDSQEELPPIIRIVKQWQPIESIEKAQETSIRKDDSSDKEKELDLGGAPVPKFVEIKVVFGQTLQQKEQEYNLGFSVPSTVDNMPQSIFAIRPPVIRVTQG